METIKELRKICQSGKIGKDVPLAFGYSLHRRLSIYITWSLLRIFKRLKANYVSMAMIFLALASLSLIWLRSSTAVLMVGFILLYISFLLDKVDGEVARYQSSQSVGGIYLDELYHLLIPPLFIVSFFYPSASLAIVELEVVLAALLTVFWRYNRKIPLIIYAKSGAIMDNVFNDFNPEWRFTKKVRLLGIFPLRIASIVERFDVVLLVALVVSLVGVFIEPVWVGYFLHVYVVLSIVYFLRWNILYYLGAAEERVRDLDVAGY